MRQVERPPSATSEDSAGSARGAAAAAARSAGSAENFVCFNGAPSTPRKRAANRNSPPS
jgi:hypothetical protein